MKNIIIIFGIILASCHPLQKKVMDNNKIFGRWCSVSPASDYPHLTFRQDGYVIFDCRIDTVFGLTYTFNKNQLVVMPTNRQMNKNKVLKFTNDSLILETLLEYKTKQVYYRCDNKD